MTDTMYEERCPCCSGNLKRSIDYMDHILMESEHECPRCGWYSHYNTGNYEITFQGRWSIFSHHTYSSEQFKQCSKKEKRRELIWKFSWPILKPLFNALNKMGY